MAWAPDYITTGQLKSELRIDDTIDDARLARAVTAASRAVDRYTHRQFGLVDAPEARTYSARYSRSRRRWLVNIDDLMTTVGLVVATGAGGITALGFRPANAAAKARPWTRLLVDAASAVQPNDDVDGVTITARWGWTTVPVAVQQATLLQAMRFAQRNDAPFGVTGSPDLGGETRLLARVDPDVEVALSDYCRSWLAV